MGKSAWEKEWDSLIKKEEKYLKKHEIPRESKLNSLLADKVPDKLQGVLDAAFCKGFWLVFSKGSAVIEKTYSPEKGLEDYKIREFAARVKKDRRTLRAFSKTARGGNRVNVAISAVEGVGLGVLGIGVPDIPLFLGMILKSVYQIALAYGFGYETREGRYFILKLIETALEDGEAVREKNAAVDQLLYKGELEVDEDMLGEQVETTSQALSEELLYMKFIQGLPLVGVIGGAGDAICLKRVTDYASLKYQKRFLAGWKKR